MTCTVLRTTLSRTTALNHCSISIIWIILSFFVPSRTRIKHSQTYPTKKCLFAAVYRLYQLYGCFFVHRATLAEAYPDVPYHELAAADLEQQVGL